MWVWLRTFLLFMGFSVQFCCSFQEISWSINSEASSCLLGNKCRNPYANYIGAEWDSPVYVDVVGLNTVSGWIESKLCRTVAFWSS